MARNFFSALLLAVNSITLVTTSASGQSDGSLSPGDRMLADYFRREADVLAENCLANVHSLSDWQNRRSEYRRQLQEMLGLWPMPERTDLHPVVTGSLDRESFTVETRHHRKDGTTFPVEVRLTRFDAGSEILARPPAWPPACR